MPKLTVNGQEIEFDAGMTVLQACEIAGEEIPRFCYHERLQIAGSCRMCLVQIEGGPPKPAASCAMPAGDGMVVHTNSPMVKKAREGVMEFLLINHPLDCPICDQGGECDLQDQAMTYGCGNSRYEGPKRGVKQKDFGPLVKAEMTRCIHCTRCIRFLTDVAGCDDLGATGRGETMEVGTFIESNISSEMSGNIIDLCPVGALTSKPFAFRARSWELKHTESIDVMDAVGSAIRVDTRGPEVMRILPRLNEDINEEWISDKTRFACDGLKLQRLDRPMIRNNGKLQDATWDEALSLIADKIQGLDSKEVAAIAGDQADSESMFLLKELLDNLKVPHYDCRQDGANLDASKRASYLFNSTIAGIEDADALLVIGANPRFDTPIVNARIRKRMLQGDFPIAVIGAESDLTYKYNYLGQSVDIIKEITSGKHEFSKILKAAKNPLIIVGSGVYNRDDSSAIMAEIHALCTKMKIVTDEWNGFNVLHTAASRVGGLELGFVPQKDGGTVSEILDGAKSGKIKAVYLLASDEIDTSKLKKSFVIYQGHHGDAGATAADVILPGAAYTEKNATYVNIEGRAQHTRLASFPPGQAKEDWRIIQELASAMGITLSYESLRQVRDALAKVAPSFANINTVTPAKWESFGKKSSFSKEAIEEVSNNFYMTDPVSRCSPTMARCSDVFIENRKDKKKRAA